MDAEAIVASHTEGGTLLLQAASFAIVGGEATNAILTISQQYALQRGAVAELLGALLVYRHSARFAVASIWMLADDAKRRARTSLSVLSEEEEVGTRRSIVRACLVAAQFIDLAASRILASLCAGGGGLAEAETALVPLRQAYKTLAAVASEREGCRMVAFGSCCCCSPKRIRGG